MAFWQTDDCKKYPHDVIRLATKRPSSARTASRAATQSSPCFSTLEYRCSRRAERMQLQPAPIVLNGFFTTLELSLSSSSTSVQTPDLEGATDPSRRLHAKKPVISDRLRLSQYLASHPLRFQVSFCSIEHAPYSRTSQAQAILSYGPTVTPQPPPAQAEIIINKYYI